MTEPEAPAESQRQRLRIFLAGGVRVEVESPAGSRGRQLELPGGWRTQALLAYLALNDRSIPLTELADEIWGAAARSHNVTKALSILRGSWRKAGVNLDDWLTHPEPGFLTLVRDDLHVVWVDIRVAEDDLDRGRYREALDRIPGPICAGVPSKPWLDGARSEVADRFDAPLKKVEVDARRRGDLDLLRRALIRRLHLDPGNERARRHLEDLDLELDDTDDARVAVGLIARPSSPPPPEDGLTEDRHRPRLSRRIKMIGTAVLVVGVAGGISLLLHAGGTPEPSAAACPSGRWLPSVADRRATGIGSRRASERPTLAAEIDIDSKPTSLAVGREGIWVAGRNGLTLIDPRTNRVRGASIDVGGRAYAIALTEDRIWTTRRDGYLVEVDRASRRPAGSATRYGTGSAEVTTAAGAVWVNSYSDDPEDPVHGQLIRIGACTRHITRYRVGRIANTVRAGFDSLWLTDSTNDEVIRFDPRRRKVLARIASSGDPQDVAMGDGVVWVTDYYDQRIYRVDPATNRSLPRALTIGSEPGGVAVGLGAVWTASYANGEVSRIALKTLRAEPNAVRGDDLLTDVAVGFERVWVTPNGGTSVQSFSPY